MDVIPAVKVAVRPGVIYIMASLIRGGYCSLIVVVTTLGTPTSQLHHQSCHLQKRVNRTSMVVEYCHEAQGLNFKLNKIGIGELLK